MFNERLLFVFVVPWSFQIPETSARWSPQMLRCLLMFDVTVTASLVTEERVQLKALNRVEPQTKRSTSSGPESFSPDRTRQSTRRVAVFPIEQLPSRIIRNRRFSHKDESVRARGLFVSGYRDNVARKVAHFDVQQDRASERRKSNYLVQCLQ